MAADVAEYAASKGLEVHVYCVGKEDSCETVDDVIVHRYKPSFSIGRATFSFSLLKQLIRMRKWGEFAHIHMPYPESGLISFLFARTWKILITYQCDAPRTGGFANLIAKALDISHSMLIRRANLVAPSTDDYWKNSRLKEVFSKSNTKSIQLPCRDRSGGNPTFKPIGKRTIGFLGRPTSEKGIDSLLLAMNELPEDVCLLLAGPTQGLVDAISFDGKLASELENNGRLIQIGFLEDEQIADFYSSLDVFVLPSINSYEAFGIVQVEAMSAGTPVVASDLPGVRTIVQNTGFGEISQKGNSEDLASKILSVLNSKYDLGLINSKLKDFYLSPIPEEIYLQKYSELCK